MYLWEGCYNSCWIYGKLTFFCLGVDSLSIVGCFYLGLGSGLALARWLTRGRGQHALLRMYNTVSRLVHFNHLSFNSSDLVKIFSETHRLAAAVWALSVLCPVRESSRQQNYMMQLGWIVRIRCFYGGAWVLGEGNASLLHITFHISSGDLSLVSVKCLYGSLAYSCLHSKIITV